MIKKIVAAVMFFTFMFTFTPALNVAFQPDKIEVSAKGYKSGVRSFNPGTTNRNNQVTPQRQRPRTDAAARTNRGGLLRGMFLGGMAGLLFGSMLGNLGMLGSVFGFLINVLAIIALIYIAAKLFKFFTRDRKEAVDKWRK